MLSGRRPGAWAIRILGAALVVFGLLPGFLLLDPGRVGPFGEWVLALEAEALELMLWGTVSATGLGFVLARTVGDLRLRSVVERIRSALIRIESAWWAATVGAASTTAAWVLGTTLSGGLPTNVDSMAQLLQARFVAEGMLAGPVPDPIVSQVVINTLITPEGWVSFYPPAHTLVLALGVVAGIPFLVGPVLTGVTAGASALFFDEILPDRPGTARLAAILTALSPFLLFIGGGYLSHTTCAAGVAVAAYSGARARRGSWWWSVAAGAGTGLAVATRPWTALVLLGALLPVLWWRELRARKAPGTWVGSRVAGAAAGGAPFAILLFGYDLRFFGGATRLGYEAAYGPAHGLGFHLDPWGFPYGIREALGFTASDLTALSLHLLETPLPLVALVGGFLLVARKLPAGTGALLAWAAAPIAANFLYWHHGFHMGPRMLYEAAPAWAGLTALSVAWLAGESSVRSVALWTFVVALVGPLGLVPARIGANTWDAETRARMIAPDTAGEDRAPALVFVHESWSERVSARLQAAGIRLDSMEVAFRRNDLCRLDRYAKVRLGGGGALPELVFTAAPEAPPHLSEVTTPGEQVVRLDPSEELSAECSREIRADRTGTVPLAPLLWQGDLRGVEFGDPVFVRDLGPDANEATMRAWPGRTPYLWVPDEPGAPPRLIPYDEGMELLWGDG